MSHERIARIANGAIVLAAGLATMFDPRFVWLVLLMGIGLVFSGAANFCGFKWLLERRGARRADS